MTEAPGRLQVQMQVRLHWFMWHLLSRRSCSEGLSVSENSNINTLEGSRTNSVTAR